MCELNDITSEGDYTEYTKHWGTACYSVDENGEREDWLDEDEDDSDVTDRDYEHDHYHCRECGSDFELFDCEIDRTTPSFPACAACVKCHIWQEAEKVEEAQKPEPKQDDDVTKLLTQADARQVIEELLKG